MENNINFFDKTFSREIYEHILEVGEKHNLMDTLVKMQTSQGIGRDAAEQTAKLCVAAVASCESVRDEVSENAASVLEKLFAQIDKGPATSQALSLQKLYFGLTFYSDPDTLAELEKGTSADELFWKFYSEESARKPQQSVEELKSRVRAAAENFCISPELMALMVKKAESSGDYLASAAALGEAGTVFKCVAAMDIYLNNADSMTIHEAANIACAGAQTQAAADAVSKGLISRDLAKKILIAASIAAVIIGVGILCYSVSAAAAAAKTATAVAGAYNAASIFELPAVFAEFATVTTASGAPATQLVAGASSAVKTVASIKTQAMIGQAIGVLISAAGLVMTTLSDKAAAAIGKLSVGFRGDNKSVAEGLNIIAGDELTARSVSFGYDQFEEAQDEEVEEFGQFVPSIF